jgi:hypothetical protein
VKRFGVVLLALLLAWPALVTAARSRPILRLGKAEPLTVRGAHFASRERVTVKLRVAGTTAKRVVRSSPMGTFRVSFQTSLTDDRCGGAAFVTAVGTRGDRATLKLPEPECPPA